MSLIAPLFAALAELFVSGKSLEEVAQSFQLGVQDLARAFQAARGNLWKGHFARALQSPDNRPELLIHFSRLAALEHHYGSLMAQWLRAEETCREVRSLKEPDPTQSNLKVRMKADAFSFRVQQAAARILRDIQKAEVALQKMIASPYITFKPEKAEDLHPAKNTPPNPMPACSPPTQSPVTQSPATQSTPAVDLPRVALRREASNPTSASNSPAAATIPEAQEEAQEFQDLLFKHRHRINNTPSKDRPQLINKLLGQKREKQLVA